MNAVMIEDLRQVFPASRTSGDSRVALDGVSFSVQEGEIFGLLGPNGGGKTTLFRILSTLLKPTGGRAAIFGEGVVENPSAVRRKIGVVFQNPSLDKKLTVLENLVYQGRLYGLSGAGLRRRVDELMARLKLEDRSRDFVETLSGGLQRRVEIAKGLLHKPQLLLMDEPSTGLDPGARRDMWEYLHRLKTESVTVLITTHLMEEAEKCDRLAILHQGQRVALGTPSELKDKIGGDVVRVQTAEPAELCRKIRAKFGADAAVVDGFVRIEIPRGHAFIPQLVEAFPGLIEAMSVGKPTLEDVFAHETGHRFWWQAPENGETS